MKALILNDVHLGVQRTAGTTPMSAINLQDYLQDSFCETIHEHLDKHLILNGDLLDSFEISLSQVWKTAQTLQSWIDQSSPMAKLFMLAGNHDLSPKAERISSFELLCRILKSANQDKVEYVLMGGLTNLYDNVWALPHVPNQFILDLEAEKALETIKGPATLLLHCNYDNNFAQVSDHSLNLTEDIAKQSDSRGIKLVIAHEHQKRVLRYGMVYITGNQWSSSIADCLGNEAKYAHILEDDGVTITPFMTQDLSADYIEVDWTDLASVEDQRFIRVTGKVPQDLAADVITTISKYRSKSNALVIGNAVKIEGMEGMDELEEISFEQIKAFDVLSELLNLLEPKEQEVVKRLMETNTN